MSRPFASAARWLALAGLLFVSACSGFGAREVPLSPGAAACRVASLTNPAEGTSGLGGTGSPAVRGPDPGGIGGTGQVASGSGIGGTGRPVVAGEEGLGGTGIVGVVTGFASICVNGVEVEYEADTPVERDGRASRLGELAVGQLVAVQASGSGDQLRARRIQVLDAAVGPLTGLDAAAGRFKVMGQPAAALEPRDLQGLVVGDWVRVSGQRLASGEIRATRVQRTAPGLAMVTGPYAVSAAGEPGVGATPLWPDPALEGLAAGQDVGAHGAWEGGRLRVQEVRVQPTRSVVSGSQRVLLQGYVHALQGRELRLGYASVTLDDQVRIEGGDATALRVDQPVQVQGRVDARQRVVVERVQLRGEGLRAAGTTRAPAAAPVAAPVQTEQEVRSSGGSDSSGRGRGRGRGGREGGDGGSGGSNAGSNSGSSSGGDSGGDSGRGRGRGRGGDSGSSGSGSSGGGSGSSGSGSSGSGSSGSGSGSSGSGSSGSSGSSGGDSGGESGRGRGRGRGGRD